MEHNLSFLTAYDDNLPWFRKNIIFFAVTGSNSYGTNIVTSDYDFKGVVIVPKEYYFGFLNRFEQADKFPGVDCSVMEFKKFIQLVTEANPNLLELLYTDQSNILIETKYWKKIIANRHLFLSKKVMHTFQGYSFSQLKRIKTHKRYLLNPVEHKPTRDEFGLPEHTVIPQDQLMAADAIIKKKLDEWNPDFGMLDKGQRIEIENKINDILIKIVGASIYLNRDELWKLAAVDSGMSTNFIKAIQKEKEYNAKKTEYDNYQEWKKNRNKARATLEAEFGFDLKHAGHLVRLSRMCKEILTTGEVIVKRPDAEELKSIRAGAWTYDQVIEFAEQMEEEVKELYKTSPLPREPNRKAIDKLCSEIIEEFIYSS